jgi:hypothetical protein
VERSLEAPEALQNSGPRASARLQAPGRKLKVILGWTGAGVALLAVAGVVLVLLLSH